MDPMGLSCTSSLVERRSLHGNSLPTELWGASRTSSESTGRDGVFRVFLGGGGMCGWNGPTCWFGRFVFIRMLFRNLCCPQDVGWTIETEGLWWFWNKMISKTRDQHSFKQCVSLSQWLTFWTFGNSIFCRENKVQTFVSVFVGSQSIGYSKFTTRGWLVLPGADGAGCVSRLLGVSWRWMDLISPWNGAIGMAKTSSQERETCFPTTTVDGRNPKQPPWNE